MSNFDPFDPTISAEADELRALQTALRLAQGFALFLVRCNDPVQRRDIVAALRADRPDATFEEIELREPIRHLLDELKNCLTQPAPTAVLVSGLEYSLPDPQNAARAPAIANLNAARNSFPRVLKCPLVLFVPEYALVAMMQSAPDFFSVRSGLYFFARTPEQSGALASAMLDGNMWQAENLSGHEKVERVREISNLLADYQMLPKDRRDRMVELRLMTRLAGIFLSIGSWDKAKVTSEKCVDLARELKDRVNEGIALQNLGNITSLTGEWSKSESSLKQSLKIFQEIDSPNGISTSLNSLGLLAQEQENLETAEFFFTASLQVIGASNNELESSRAWNNLGMIWQIQGKNTKAQDAYQRSANFKKKVGDVRGEAYTLANLGNLYLSESQWQKALESYERAETIFRETSDLFSLVKTLNNISLLYFRQSDLEEASSYAKQAKYILENLPENDELKKSLRFLDEIEAISDEEKTVMSETICK